MSKFYGFLLLLLSANVIAANGKSFNERIFENEITEMLECLRGVLKTGIEEVGMPSFEPIEVPHLLVNISQLGIESAAGFFIVNNGAIAGFTNWELSDLEIKPTIIGGLGGALKAKINLPLLNIQTEYVTDLSVAGINVFGDGGLSLDAGHLQFELDAKLLLNRITLSKFRLLPTIKTINAKITGFLNSEEHSALASQVVNEVGVRWINEKSEDFATAIEQILQGLVNNYATKNLKEGKNIEDIISAILERCPLPIR